MMDLQLPYRTINPNAMKRLIGTIVMMVMLTELLSSCYLSKNLNKEKKPFTDEFLSRLEPGKRYEFKLKTGQKQTVYLTGVDNQTISGFYFGRMVKVKRPRVIIQPVSKVCRRMLPKSMYGNSAQS